MKWLMSMLRETFLSDKRYGNEAEKSHGGSTTIKKELQDEAIIKDWEHGKASIDRFWRLILGI